MVVVIEVWVWQRTQQYVPRQMVMVEYEVKQKSNPCLYGSGHGKKDKWSVGIWRWRCSSNMSVSKGSISPAKGTESITGSVESAEARSYLHAAVESLQAVETLQWENILTVGSASNSGNHSTNSGIP
ncbi:hypothetical protein Tco_0702181 [Tanacetum coccineum]|uniref:Uncharacterized protein n=1 Tax=Tanacetum coccineum TaxID=301880 RepID=A0ABQ4XWY8_9ASTR